MVVKSVKFTSLLIFGLIMTLFSACFSPIDVIPSNTQDTDVPGGQNGSFPVDIYVNQGARFVAGASSANIQDRLYNFVQLIVVNDNTGAIAAFDESRKEKMNDPAAFLSIDGLPYGEDYTFLLLLGNWERNVGADVSEPDDDVILAYNEEARPVLLAAGYKKLTVTGSHEITVTMYPLDIDTAFKASGPLEAQFEKIGKAVELRADKDWRVEWTIGNGLKRLIEAGNGNTLPEGNRKFFLDGGAGQLTGELTTANSTLTGSLPDYNGLEYIATTHWVNFYVEYVPFNLAGADWGDYNNESKFSLSPTSPPVWVIRNGLNNEKQTEKTDFAIVGKPNVSDYKDYNGNGGVLFTILNPHEGGYYVKKDGNDSNTGTFYDPFKTLEKALASAAGTAKPVIVIGTLTKENSRVTDMVALENVFRIVQTVTVKGHPDPADPPVLMGESGKRVLATGTDKNQVVTLENITLTGGKGQKYGAGVYIDMGTLTLGEGAKVTGNGDVNIRNGTGKTERGGGVYVNEGAVFKLDGGEISGNWTGLGTDYAGGGGLFVNGTTANKGTADLIRGIISDNFSNNDGGGVSVNYGIVNMYEGASIHNNNSKDDGGGIVVDRKSKFTMYGGRITSNTSFHHGGGVRLESGTVYIAEGALVAGDDHSDRNWAGTDRYNNYNHDATYKGHAYRRISGTTKNKTLDVLPFTETY
jgi:hypothetical protein